MINDDDADLIYIFIVTHKLERIYLLASKIFLGEWPLLNFLFYLNKSMISTFTNIQYDNVLSILIIHVNKKAHLRLINLCRWQSFSSFSIIKKNSIEITHGYLPKTFTNRFLLSIVLSILLIIHTHTILTLCSSVLLSLQVQSSTKQSYTFIYLLQRVEFMCRHYTNSILYVFWLINVMRTMQFKIPQDQPILTSYCCLLNFSSMSYFSFIRR